MAIPNSAILLVVYTSLARHSLRFKAAKLNDSQKTLEAQACDVVQFAALSCTFSNSRKA
jgi:hypothetical protein